jgi:hypothetical protein
MSEWNDQLITVLNDWYDSGSRHLIISPDVDGLLSAVLLQQEFPSKIIGFYTTSHLVLFDGYTPDDAKSSLWLDHDVNQLGIRCVGQHLVNLRPGDGLPTREPMSWNPNVWVGQAWEGSFSGIAGKKRDKYPLGTAHFIHEAVARNVQASTLIPLLAHADGTWFALDIYKANGEIWRQMMFENSAVVSEIMDYRNKHQHHELHAKILESLHQSGISTGLSRSPRATLLPDELKILTGSQSVSGRAATNPEQYAKNLFDSGKMIARMLGMNIEIGSGVAGMISGNRLTVYPNRIDDLDSLLVDEDVFSHAFTDLRTLSYTTNFKLT